MQNPIARLVLIAALAFAAGLWAQQSEEEAVENPVEPLAERVTRIENTLARLSTQPSSLSDASINLRLQRLEASVNRIETQAIRRSPSDGGMMTARMLESRLRALESQVSRMRR